MGLIARIFKHDGNSFSNDGISHFHDQICIANAAGPFDPNPNLPAVVIVPGYMPGTLIAVPSVLSPGGTWIADKSKQWMFGGTFIYSSDDRFGLACVREHNGRWIDATGIGARGMHTFGAIPLHDRAE
jgi:hypothetical protein